MENERKTSRVDVERYNLEILLRRPSLRASISRRSSQVRRDTITTPDTTCGLWFIRGRWLQTFANRTSFLLFYEVFGSFYASYVAYLYGTLTTLEKRFKFSSGSAGLMIASGSVSKFAVCFVLSLLPFKTHRAFGVGVFVILLSTVIFTSTHFLYGPNPEGQENLIQYIDDNFAESNRTCSKEAEDNNAFFLLLLTQILHGVGGGLFLTQGQTYKDDNIHLPKSPSLATLLSILQTLGPASGYWLSSVCLKTHASLEKVTDDDEPHWVGAWWLGTLVIGFILLVVGFLLVLFPPTLPKAAVRRIFHKVRRRAEEKENIRGDETNTFKSLFINSTFISSQFSGTFNVTGFLSYFLFLPKYVEIQYRISASTANLVAGTITLIAAAFGIVMGSSVMSRYRPNRRILAGWSIIVGVLSIGGLIYFTYIGCNENDTQIKALASQYSSLNNFCDCGFHPVCMESQITFLCHGNCHGIFPINGTKAHKNLNQTLHNDDFVKILCPVDCYPDFLIFTIITCSLSFIYASSQSFNFLFEIKRPDNAIHTVGLDFINTIIIVLPPIVFGYIIDKSCLLWDDNCNHTGNCWLYDTQHLRQIMNFTAIGFTILCIIFNVGVWCSVKNLTLYYDNDDDDDDDDDDDYADEGTTQTDET